MAESRAYGIVLAGKESSERKGDSLDEIDAGRRCGSGFSTATRCGSRETVSSDSLLIAVDVIENALQMGAYALRALTLRLFIYVDGWITG